MKKLFKIALILILFVFAQAKANAAVLNEFYLSGEIENILSQKIKEQIGEDFELKIKPLSFKELEVKDGEISIDVDINLKSQTNNKMAKVQIYSDGVKDKLFYTPVDLKIYENVYVATTTVQKDEEFSFKNIKTERKNVTACYKYVVKKEEKLNGKRAKKYFNKGDLIDSRYVETPLAVEKQNIVLINFKTGGLDLTLDGIALEDGKIGDYIKVKNEKYNKIYTGKVISPNKIIVNI